MGITDVEEGRGGVAFVGPLENGYRACLWSRIASRVLLQLEVLEAADADGLYAGVRRIPWMEHLDPDGTLAVHAVGRHASLTSHRFVALKTKDAIVDSLRDASGRRPDVDTRSPDLRVHVHLAEGVATVSLDLAGRGLHDRGLGRSGGAAPLRESLAAAILHLVGWPARAEAREALFDPMCGSATLLVEAACMARDMAPGLARERHGFEGWAGHRPEIWEQLVGEARERAALAASRVPQIHGADEAEAAVKAARRNVERAGQAGVVNIARRALADCRPPVDGVGLVITNPPYGERLGEVGELGPLYEQLGDLLKHRFPGWTAVVLSGNPALTKRVGLRARRKHVLFNGPIECRLLEYPIAAEGPTGDRGPGWRRPGPDAPMLRNRLRKNHKRLGRWAKREGVDCYRLYNRDIPEYRMVVDVYGDAARIEEIGRSRSVDPAVVEQRVRDAMIVVPEVLGIASERVTLRVRRRRGPSEQHERRSSLGELHEVHEGDLRFLVNMTDYLDTGLFLDDRGLRALIRELAAGRDFLNLFAYTCAATVAAGKGGARTTTSVDLSNTYLEWGRRNLDLNGLTGPEHSLVRGDVLGWMRGASPGRRYGLVFLAPPTYSRSRGMEGDFDVQRDHVALLRATAALLAPEGVLLFSTNSERFELDGAALPGLEVEEITGRTTPEDFRHRPGHRAFRLVRGAARS